MSPMYGVIWEFIADTVEGSTGNPSKYPSWIVQLESYRIVGNRHGMAIDRFRRPVWHHICRPRVLYRAIAKELTTKDDPWFDVGINCAYFNKDLERCAVCGYVPTKSELVAFKLAALGMKIGRT